MSERELQSMDRMAGLLLAAGRYEELKTLRGMIGREFKRFYPDIPLESFTPGELSDLYFQSYAGGIDMRDLIGHYIDNQGRKTTEMHAGSDTKLRYGDFDRQNTFREKVLSRGLKYGHVIDSRDSDYNIDDDLTQRREQIRAGMDDVRERMKEAYEKSNGERTAEIDALEQENKSWITEAEIWGSTARRMEEGGQFDTQQAFGIALNNSSPISNVFPLEDPYEDPEARGFKDVPDEHYETVPPIQDPFESGLLFDTAGLQRSLGDLSNMEGDILKEQYRSDIAVNGLQLQAKRASLNEAPNVESRNTTSAQLSIGLGDGFSSPQNEELADYNKALSSLNTDVSIDSGAQAITKTAAQIASEESIRQSALSDSLSAIRKQKRVEEALLKETNFAREALAQAVRAGLQIGR